MMRDRLAHAKEQFAENTSKHVMTVVHEDGLYRHLRFAEPGTGMWSWNVVTWPGHLALSGDIADGFMFRRIEDMLTFFLDPVNPQYWAEKMPQTISFESYSEERFREVILDWVREWREEMVSEERKEFDAKLEADVLSNGAWEFEAIPAMQNFVHGDFDFDGFDGDFKDYDHHFLLACVAVHYSAVEYRKHPSEGKQR